MTDIIPKKSFRSKRNWCSGSDFYLVEAYWNSIKSAGLLE